MAAMRSGSRRRARPGLGTLVEVGVWAAQGNATPAAEAAFERAFEAAFEAAFTQIRDVQACLSRFDPDSDLARFQRAPCGGSIVVRPATRTVLAAAHALHAATAGGFDISLGTSPDGWRCDGDRLFKLDDAVVLDLGGIGKGHAVDRAVQALIDLGCPAGWVNAGGDLRVFGAVDLPVRLRDEANGGVRDFMQLRDGAFATSHFGPTSRSALAARPPTGRAAIHASVAAPLCLWADALTKVVAQTRNASHPLLARYDAVAWIH